MMELFFVIFQVVLESCSVLFCDGNYAWGLLMTLCIFSIPVYAGIYLCYRTIRKLIYKQISERARYSIYRKAA